MTDLSGLTATNNYFEDFTVGTVIRHARGKTITPLENVLVTNLVMNTAQGHFNEDAMAKLGVPGVIVYGGVNFSTVLGLASQDCCENAIAEIGLDNIRLMKSVFHGDSIYAYTEVLETRDADRSDAGIVRFRHHGFNQKNEAIVLVDRTAIIKRKSHWVKA